MGMSKKAQALLTGEKRFEFNKYQVSMQEAINDFLEEQAKAQAKQTKKSGWSKLLGGIAFVATAAVLASNPIGWMTAGAALIPGVASGSAAATAIAASVGATAAGTAAAYGHHKGAKDVTLGKTQEEFAENIYDPKFARGRAATEKKHFEGQIGIEESALQAYEEGGLESALFQNVGRTSSFLGDYDYS